MKLSIIIPTYNHCYDLLQPCLETLIKYTDLSDAEVLIVANGCVDDTRAVVESFNNPTLKLLWYDEALGFPGANNKALEVAKGDFIVLLNNDVILQEQEFNHWIDRMLSPFENSEVGITGPLLANGHQSPTGKDFIVFFCAAIKREVFEKIGYLDEQFRTGGAEDIDYCIRTELAGYKLVQVSDWKPGMHYVNFPMIHFVNGTVAKVDDWDSIFHGNLEILHNKYKYLKEKKEQLMKKFKYSIVIPTYNHLEDALKPCIESLLKYTNFEEVELVIVGNGCTDGTYDFLLETKEKLGENLNILWDPKPLGYTRANNWGIEQSRGEYIILLNNDTAILESPINEWIKMLEHPFLADPTVGMTGPMKAFCPYSNRDFLIFFCVMFKKSILDEIGYPDEIFSPGFGEDTDFSVRVQEAGYKLIQVPDEDRLYYAPDRMVGGFPIWHAGEATFGEYGPEGLALLRKNRLILLKRFQGNRGEIKLNIGCGDKLLEGYTNIDLFGDHVDFNMDVRNLDFDDNSVKEIYGSHIFEHISPYEINSTLDEWFRILVPNGHLILEMPDIKTICEKFAAADKDERYRLINCIYGTGNGIESPHLFGWYDEILRDHLIEHGFDVISIDPYESEHWGYNLKVIAIKDGLPKGYFSYLDIEDYRNMVKRIPENGTMVEIGTFRGRSLCSVADIIKKKNIKVIAIDTFGGTPTEESDLNNQYAKDDIYSEFKSNLKKYDIENNVQVFKGENQNYSSYVEDYSLDLVFIDADHSYEAVKLDINNWKNKIKNGGILAGHDIRWYDVEMAVKEEFGDKYIDCSNIWFVEMFREISNNTGKIYDCFPFNDELDILEIRLNEMYDIVEKFIIVEGTKNFANKDKPLYFYGNRKRFEKFSDKIIHIIVDEWPEYHDSWTYERYQRDQIDRGLEQCNCQDNDIIIISDLDEIPKAEIVKKYKINMGILNLEQTLYYYNFHCRNKEKWNWAKILPYYMKKQMIPCQVRYFYDGNENAPTILDSGWHFSYFGDVEAIIEKIKSSAHQEYNKEEFKDKEKIKECVKQGIDLYGRNLQYEIVEIDQTFPKFVTNNIEYYKNKGLIYE